MSWWHIVLAVVGVALVASLLAWWRWRPQLRFVLRVARALATDPRLPRLMRWMFAAALAIKSVPLPDLGIDEALLAVAGLWLVVGHRRTFHAIVAESRAAGAQPAAKEGLSSPP